MSVSDFRSPQLMNADDTAVVVIDMQEKLMPVIENGDALLKSVQRLIAGAGILSVPFFVTEQYPQGLGKTVAGLSDNADGVFEKKMFSLRECSPLLQQLKDSGVRNLLFVGIEAHICVMQSVLDSIANGFKVAICVDAVGSRNEQDKVIAIRRLDSNGVTLTTVESALFEWCETANHPQFKAISQLVK